MFGIGSTELLVILVVALIVIGPKSLPGIAKTAGKIMGDFKRITNDFQRTMNAEVAQEEHEQRKKEAEKELFGDKEEETKTSEPKKSAVKITEKEDLSPTIDASTGGLKQDELKDELASNDNANVGADATNIDTNAVDKVKPIEAEVIDEVPADSPLAKALAKAENEAKALDKA